MLVPTLFVKCQGEDTKMFVLFTEFYSVDLPYSLTYIKRRTTQIDGSMKTLDPCPYD